MPCVRWLAPVSLPHISDSCFVVLTKPPVWATRLATLRDKTFWVYLHRKSGAECFPAGSLPSIFHNVFYQSNLLALDEYHALGKSRSCAGPLRSFLFLEWFPRLPARLNLTLQLKNWAPRTLKEKTWMAAIFLPLWNCVCDFSCSGFI